MSIGFRIDLLAPAIYLTDILAIVLFVTNLFGDRTYLTFLKKHKYLLVVIFVFAIINCIYSTSIPVTIYKWFKVIEYSFISIYFFGQKIIRFSEVVKTLFYSSAIFSLIGILQFIKGGTIGGLLYFLGERTFSMGTPGIALVSLNGAEYLRAYSTFSHPNSLAGYLGAIILLALLSGQIKKNSINYLGVLIILVCFILTFSISAYLGIFFAFAFYLLFNNRKSFKITAVLAFSTFVIVSLFQPIVSSWLIKSFPGIGQNIVQRLDLAYTAGIMVSQKFWIGEGLGTFIVNIPTLKNTFSYSWLLQPVHNIFLLIFAETGIFGIIVFFVLLFRQASYLVKNNKIYLLLPLLLILFTGMFDHYWLTLQQNTLLLSVLIGISFNVNSL